MPTHPRCGRLGMNREDSRPSWLRQRFGGRLGPTGSQSTHRARIDGVTPTPGWALPYLQAPGRAKVVLYHVFNGVILILKPFPYPQAPSRAFKANGALLTREHCTGKGFGLSHSPQMQIAMELVSSAMPAGLSRPWNSRPEKGSSSAGAGRAPYPSHGLLQSPCSSRWPGFCCRGYP